MAAIEKFILVADLADVEGVPQNVPNSPMRESATVNFYRFLRKLGLSFTLCAKPLLIEPICKDDMDSVPLA